MISKKKHPMRVTENLVTEDGSLRTPGMQKLCKDETMGGQNFYFRPEKKRNIKYSLIKHRVGEEFKRKITLAKSLMLRRIGVAKKIFSIH